MYVPILRHPRGTSQYLIRSQEQDARIHHPAGSHDCQSRWFLALSLACDGRPVGAWKLAGSGKHSRCIDTLKLIIKQKSLRRLFERDRYFFIGNFQIHFGKVTRSILCSEAIRRASWIVNEPFDPVGGSSHSNDKPNPQVASMNKANFAYTKTSSALNPREKQIELEENRPWMCTFV